MNIKKYEVWDGTNISLYGATTYGISQVIEHAKQVGCKYIKWNGGELYSLNGSPIGINYKDLN